MYDNNGKCAATMNGRKKNAWGECKRYSFSLSVHPMWHYNFCVNCMVRLIKWHNQNEWMDEAHIHTHAHLPAVDYLWRMARASRHETLFRGLRTTYKLSICQSCHLKSISVSEDKLICEWLLSRARIKFKEISFLRPKSAHCSPRQRKWE